MKLHQYFVEFEEGVLATPLFGVTAHSPEDAESIIFEEIFHNQTIPGNCEVKEAPSFLKVRIQGMKVSLKAWKTKGIWYPIS